uniref:Ig-like domain-containing protein n=1 Tax=Denticeps clupeoides TaxID=299321 RepID=A0AAY4CJW9_9TELE
THFMTIYIYSIFQTAKDLFQLNPVITVEPGGTVNITCSYPEVYSSEKMSWYKQVLGQKPRCMANVERLQQVYFFEEFHDPRFRAIRSHGQLILTVTNITKPDEATYYCSVRYFDQLIFGSGTFLMVKGDASISNASVLIINLKCMQVLHEYFDGDLINYASVHLPEKGHKRALQKKAPQQNTLYSEVKYSVKSNVSVHNYC